MPDRSEADFVRSRIERNEQEEKARQVLTPPPKPRDGKGTAIGLAALFVMLFCLVYGIGRIVQFFL